MALVYRHRRLDTNQVFYVGISNNYNRPYDYGKKRNVIWNSIVKKTDYVVEILNENISYEDALELEILLIKEYGRISEKNGLLANLTDGGEGKLGCKPWNTGTKGIKKANKGSFKKGFVPWNVGIPISEKQKQILPSSYPILRQVQNINLYRDSWTICGPRSRLWESMSISNIK